MPIDSKYGRVTVERGTIGDDEPVVVFRAQDAELLPTLNYYRDACRDAGSPPQHIDAIGRAMAMVSEWQSHNHTQVPQSATVAPSATEPQSVYIKDSGA